MDTQVRETGSGGIQTNLAHKWKRRRKTRDVTNRKLERGQTRAGILYIIDIMTCG